MRKGKPRVLLLGCGNPLRGDDGAAWHVVEDLAARWADSVDIRLGQQLVPEWAADLSAADVAVIVDASLNGKTQLTPLQPHPPLVDGHALGPCELLGLTEQVYGTSPRAYLLEVPAAHFDFGEELSASTASAARTAIGILDQWLTSLSGGDVSLESGALPAPACTCGEPPRR